MHKARAFFFVCAGIFLLALAYHLGARSAGAQVGSGLIEGASITQPPYGYLAVTFCVNRVLYMSEQTPAGYWYPVPAKPVPGVPVPGTAAIIATAQNAVLLANGDVYSASYGYGGNLLGANPTPAQSISIGQLKAKYVPPGTGTAK
jgi:hypothetical protein